MQCERSSFQILSCLSLSRSNPDNRGLLYTTCGLYAWKLSKTCQPKMIGLHCLPCIAASQSCYQILHHETSQPSRERQLGARILHLFFAVKKKKALHSTDLQRRKPAQPPKRRDTYYVRRVVLVQPQLFAAACLICVLASAFGSSLRLPTGQQVARIRWLQEPKRTWVSMKEIANRLLGVYSVVVCVPVGP
jgi:hypothetical protein